VRPADPPGRYSTFWTGGNTLPPVAAGQAFFLPRFLHIILTVRLFLFGILLSSRRVTRMTNEKTTREIVYETNRDVKWICKTRRAAGPEREHREVRLAAADGGPG